MKLTRIELCCLRVADGIATPKDFERLKKTNIDPESWRSISSLVRMYLHSGIRADFADEVMLQVETPSIDIPNLKELLSDPKEPPSMTDDIMQQVFEDGMDFPLPIGLLKDPDPPPVMDFVMDVILGVDSEDSEEFRSEDLLEAVFADIDFDEGIDEVVGEELEREYLHDDDSLEIFPELSEVIREEWAAAHAESKSEENDDSFDSVLQEELAKVLQEALSEESREFDETETVARDQSLIEMAEEKPFTSILERIEVSEQELNFEDDSDEEILTLTSPYVITEAVLEEQSIRFLFKLGDILVDDEANLELDIWSSISSKIVVPPLRLVRDPVDSSEDFEEFFEEKPLDSGNQAVEFISTKTIDVDSTISKFSLWTLGSLMAAAAAWLMIIFFGQSNSEIQEERVIEAFEVAEVNSLEVEELEVAENMEVQIFQAGEDAPTIIFIDSYPDGGE